jgi:outer membrane protein with beta-barrel domain
MLKASGVLRYLCGVVAVLVPALAQGEGFLDVAIGGAFTQKSDATVKSAGSSVTTTAEFDDSFSTGVRGGYWFDGLPWLGVGGMVSYFEPDVKPASVSGSDTLHLGVVPITALLMLRAPLLPSNAVPRGQLQPYLNVGPGAFATATDDHHHHDHYHDDDHGNETSVDVGVDVHAGATWMFTSRFGTFAEYRFTHYTANLDEDSHHNGSHFESTLDTHHVLVGFAWHFY